MNKKQIIVACVTGILEILLFSFWYSCVGLYEPNLYLYFKPIFPVAIAILIIGGLLIYSLRGKKK